MTQTSPVYHCVSSSRSYQLLSMRSLKILMIHYMYGIQSVNDVIRSIILPSSVKCSKGCPHGSPLLLFNLSTFQRRVTSIALFLKPCLKVSHIYLPVAYRKHSSGIWEFRGSCSKSTISTRICQTRFGLCPSF